MATAGATTAAKLALQSWIEGLISSEAEELVGPAPSSFSIDNIESMAKIDKIFFLIFEPLISENHDFNPDINFILWWFLYFLFFL